MIGNPTKVGDLAAIIDSEMPENVGLFVDVLEVLGPFSTYRLVRVKSDALGAIDGVITAVPGGQISKIEDVFLQPIRPNESPEAVDEVVEREVTA